MQVRSSCVHSTMLYGQFKGVSIIKQAWSLGNPHQLLVRSHTCCCSACLSMDFENCNIKVDEVLS